MRLYYYRDPVGNFGDDLNPWLWPQLIPGLFDEDDGTLFLGIGTLINHRVPAAPRKVVLGTGHGYGRPPRLDERWTIYCVRGPLSAERLGLAPRYAATDAAALVRTLPLPDEPKRYRLSFMPHHASTTSMDWELLCRMAGIHYIHPRASFLEILREIRRSELLVAESMHGAIVADAFRVPWIAARFYDFVLEFKWHDWCRSLGLEYRPVTLRRLLNFRSDWRSRIDRKTKPLFIALGLRRMIEHVGPSLSSDAAIDRATSRLQEEVERLRRDYFSERLPGMAASVARVDG